MNNLDILLILSIGFLIYGFKNYLKNKSKQDYYDGISNIIIGFFGMISYLTYIYIGDSWISLFSFIPLFLFGGGFGIIYRKEINNPLLFRINVFGFIIGVMILISMILFLLGYIPLL